MNTIALAGNPNSGKTTLFNHLTGARQHVGNYPGVTVEKKQGKINTDSGQVNIVDLPGTYSLSAYSLEEVVARDFITDEAPEMIIDIVDASNLERHLYLAVQFLEMGIPVSIALNMMDVAKQRKIEIDAVKLSKLLKIPVVPTIARTGKGKQELIESAVQGIKKKNRAPAALDISYGKDIDKALDELEAKIKKGNFLIDKYKTRWTALKYLEQDEVIVKRGDQANPSLSRELQRIVLKTVAYLEKTFDTYPEAIIADHRYGYIKSILKQGVIKHNQDRSRLHISDKIDKVVTSRLFGPLIMVAVIVALYQFTFTYSEVPVGWFESFFGWLGSIADAVMPDGLLKSLVISGVIDGVGGVLGFVPLIMFMFFGISLLEDSGYFARMSYMLDRVFRTFGLHGSSVMPFIISGGIAGGCAVPGVMASRTLKSPKERIATLLTVPFMNCGAKLPVFALLSAAFFPGNATKMMLIITVISWTGALIVAKILRMTVLKGEATPFLMELPPYRFPTIQGLLIHTWERTWMYIKKAGTVILGISILLWAMMTFPGLPASEGENASPEAALKYSIAGRLGTSIESVTKIAGFDWRTNIALVGGFAAKEVVVSTLGTAYSLGDVDTENTAALSQRLVKSPGWTPLTALSLIIFTIFYAPCFVTVVCIVREAGSWKWGAFSMIFNTALAFGLSTAVYQTGSLLGY